MMKCCAFKGCSDYLANSCLMPVQSMARETGCLRPRLLETSYNSTVDRRSIYRPSYTAEVQKLSHTQVQDAL